MTGWADTREIDRAFVRTVLRRAAAHQQSRFLSLTAALDKAEAGRRYSALLAAAEHLTTPEPTPGEITP